MLKSKMARFSAVALIGLASVLATEARAQQSPILVTLPAPALTAPLSFTTGFLTVTAGADLLPVPHDVTGGLCPVGQTCSEYTYQFTSTGGNLSAVWLSISSDVAIYEASPAGSVFVMECLADRFPPVLTGVNVCQQREVRFLPNAPTFNAKLVVSRSAPRVATAVGFAGFSSAFGLIQGPGVIGGTIAPITFKSKLLIANGHCPVDVTNGPDGGFTSLANSLGSPCTTTISNVAPLIDEVTGQPVQISPGEFVTYGTDSCALTLISGKYYNICR